MRKKKDGIATKKFVAKAIRKYHAIEMNRLLTEDHQERIYNSSRMIIALENLSERFINGVQCQIQDKNGDWHDVEFLKIEVLEKLLNDDKYVNAHEAIRAAINAKAVEVK